MSGGRWNYLQGRLTEPIEDIESLIEKNGKEKTPKEIEDDRWYPGHEPEKFHYQYPDEVIEEFKNGLLAIQQAQIYMQRIDWLLSGDDGEEWFLKRLKRELNELNTETNETEMF